MRIMMLFITIIILNSNTIYYCDSIWDRYNPRYAFLFQDNNARRVGDIITIIIDEATVVQEQDKRNLEKSSSANAEVTIGNTNTPGKIVATDSRYAFGGSAGNTTNRSFTDKITAIVVDVLPNGNLVIEGYKKRIISGEERIIYLIGIVRQADIRAGNTVTTDKIANLRIYYLGRGTSTRSSNPNYINRMLYKIWPW
jgi:flagellar L-ring protein precursor FlgH